MNPSNLDILTIGIFLILVLIFGSLIVLFTLLGGANQGPKKRLDRFKARFGAGRLKRSQATTQTIWADSKGTPFEQFIRNVIPRPGELRARLQKTGRKLSLTQYAMISFGCLFGTLLFITLVMNQNIVLGLLLGIIAGIGMPHFIINRMITKRLNQFTALFPDAIDLIVRGLRSGLPVTESIATVGREVEDPVGVEFRRIADGIRLGKTLEESLWSIVKRVDTADFKFFVISLSVQKETGGNLAETLDNLGDILRRRHQMKLKIKALSAEGRASAYILGALPFVMFGLINLINPDYASTLYTDPRAQLASVIGMFWLSIGGIVIAKMINFEI